MLEVTASINIPFSGCRTTAPSIGPPPRPIQSLYACNDDLAHLHHPEVHMPFDLVMTGQFPEIWNSSPLSRAHHLHSE